jgi:hypothetical protein
VWSFGVHISESTLVQGSESVFYYLKSQFVKQTE